jgi:lysophospholipase L1-like esterase
MRWRLLASFLTGALVLIALVTPAAAEHRDPDHADPGYLALGDSVAFGFNPLLLGSPPTSFVGYPEVLASRADLNLTNAACPGETSSGFISLTGLDNGCREFHGAIGLHATYSTTQLEFAVAFLRSHPRTRLVTLDIGVNDLFVLQNQCAGAVACVQAGLPGLLQTLGANLATIYGEIRGDAHYHHQLVALTYYTVNYNDPVSVGVIQAINATVAQATRAAGGEVADGFDAFKLAATPAGGDSCAAGLLIITSTAPRTCDIHPSVRGRDLLAAAIATRLDHEGHAD